MCISSQKSLTHMQSPCLTHAVPLPHTLLAGEGCAEELGREGRREREKKERNKIHPDCHSADDSPTSTFMRDSTQLSLSRSLSLSLSLLSLSIYLSLSLSLSRPSCGGLLPPLFLFLSLVSDALNRHDLCAACLTAY